MDIDLIIAAAERVKRLRQELAQAEAHLAKVSNATTTYRPPAPKTTKPSKTVEVTAELAASKVTKNVNAVAVTKALGLPSSDRRRVYKSLLRAVDRKLIKKTADGFGPR